MKLFQKNTIANKLILYIFVFSFFITLILSAIEITFDYRGDIKSLRNRIAQIRDSHINAVTERLWNLDKEGLETQLNGIIQLPDIEFAEIIETTQFESKEISEEMLHVGSIVSKNLLKDEFPLVHRINNRVTSQ